MRYLILIIIYLTLQSCSTDNQTINNNNEQTLEAFIDISNNQLTIYYNEVILDGSNSTGIIDNYKWEITNAPATSYTTHSSSTQYGYFNNEFPNTPQLSFKAREVGNYTIKLTVSSGGVESSTDVSFYISNLEPNFTFSNIHNEPFDNPNEWNVSNYSIDEDIATLPPGTWHGYQPTSTSTGGDLSFNNNITVDTGTYLYWSAQKNLLNLNTDTSKDVLFTIKSTGAEYGYELYITDAYDYVSNIRIVIDGYLITFIGDLDNRDPLLAGFVYDDFYRTNLSNHDIQIYFYRNPNGEPSVNAICNNQNITERVKISETNLQNSVDFYFYSKRRNIGGGIEITPRTTSNVVKYEISEF